MSHDPHYVGAADDTDTASLEAAHNAAQAMDFIAGRCTDLHIPASANWAGDACLN